MRGRRVTVIAKNGFPWRTRRVMRLRDPVHLVIPGMIEPELYRAPENSFAPAVPAALDFLARIGSTIAHRAWDKVFPAGADHACRIALVWVGRAGPNTLGPAGFRYGL